MYKIEKTERMDWVLIEDKHYAASMYWVTRKEWDDFPHDRSLYRVLCCVSGGIGVRLAWVNFDMHSGWQIFHTDAGANVAVADYEKWIKNQEIR